MMASVTGMSGVVGNRAWTRMGVGGLAWHEPVVIPNMDSIPD